MNLYFISAASPDGSDDRLDTFVHAPNEMTAYGDWLQHFQKEGRLQEDGTTPNYDLYLLPHDPHLPDRAIGGIIPWSLDGSPPNTTVQLVSSSWINHGPTVRADGGVWDSAAGVWRHPDDLSNEASTLFAVEALISAAATGEPVEPAVMALARAAYSTLQIVLDDGAQVPEPPQIVDDGSCDPLYGHRIDSADLGEC